MRISRINRRMIQWEYNDTYIGGIVMKIGDIVITPRGEGTIIDFRRTEVDGDVYCIELFGGEHIWRTPKGITLKSRYSVNTSKLADTIALKYNTTVDEALGIIESCLEEMP